MKAIKLVVFPIMFLSVLLMDSSQAHAQYINSVTLNPNPVFPFDTYFVSVLGDTAHTGVTFSRFESTLNGSDVFLDLRFNDSGSGLDVLTPYDLGRFMEPLPPGSYTLKVRAFRNSEVFRSRDVPFTVIPEPILTPLLLFALPLLRRRERRAAA